MSITAIARNFNGNPNLVTIVCDDSISTITTAGYLSDTAIANEIIALNNGEFQWNANDVVLITYGSSNLFAMFNYDATNETFILGQPAANVIQNASVAITAAQFNGMYAAPVELVAAAGANTLIVLEQLKLAQTYGTAAFAAGGVAAVQYDSTINGAGVIASTTLSAATFQVTASSTYTFNTGVVVLPFTTTANKGLYLSNITGAFTTGDSDLVANIWYRVINLV